MVKTKALLHVVIIVVLAGCTGRGQGIATHPETLVIPAGAPGRFLSLALSGSTLCAAFSDRETTTLKFFSLPLGPHLPEHAPAATVVDKVDLSPPLSPSFGSHVLAARGGIIDILYLDREGDDKLVLKLASKPLEAEQWDLDIMEPAGEPLAVLQDDSGTLSLFWAAGGLLMRALPSGGAVSTLLGSITPVGRASAFAPDGFTVYDGGTHSLFAVSWDQAEYACRAVPGATAVQSSLLAPGGGLSVLTWDASTSRLILLEQQPRSGRIARTTVTLSEDTGTVALLPARAPAAHLFLFDEARQSGGPRVQYALSAIAPGSLLGASGSRYRKATLLAGEEPIEGFAALETQDALYVLALQGTLKLIRVALN